jgi:hypothetical protein
MVTDVIEKSAARPGGSAAMPFFGGRVGIKDISMMTRQLASLVKANIPLVEALNALVEQIEHEVLKVVLEKVRQDVNEGLSLAKALSARISSWRASRFASCSTCRAWSWERREAARARSSSLRARGALGPGRPRHWCLQFALGSPQGHGPVEPGGRSAAQGRPDPR